MKSNLKMTGIIVFTMIIGFGFVSCGENDEFSSNSENDSLNGIWETSLGWQVTFSGDRAVLSAVGTPSPLIIDAVNKGMVKLGDQIWRNVKRTGDLTWSGEQLRVQYYTTSPNVAIGTNWTTGTFIMGADGQTLDAQYTGDYTRSSYSLNGVWETSVGWQVTFSGSTGVLSAVGSPSPLILDAINKGMVKIGDPIWRNVTSTGILTWSGEQLRVQYYTTSPNVAISINWTTGTFIMGTNGQILDAQYTGGYNRRR